MNNRIAWVDTLKTCVLFLVVLGHFMPSGIAKTVIYSFHVPLFFIISGWLDATLGKGNRFRVRALLIPYVGWALLSWVAYVLCYERVQCGLVTAIIPLNGFVLWNTPIWFLWVLFFVQAFAPIATSKSKHRCIVFLLVLCGLLTLDVGFDMGWCKNILAYRQIGLGLCFYITGRWIAHNDVLRWFDTHKLLVFILLPIGICAGILNGKINIYAWGLNSYLLMIVASLSLSIFIMWVCNSFLRWNIVCSSGIVILSTHFFVLALWRHIFSERLRADCMFCVLSSLVIFIAYYLLLHLYHRVKTQKTQKRYE